MMLAINFPNIMTIGILVGGVLVIFDALADKFPEKFGAFDLDDAPEKGSTASGELAYIDDIRIDAPTSKSKHKRRG